LPGISEFIAVKQTVAVFHGSLAGDAQSRWAVVLCVCVCVSVCVHAFILVIASVFLAIGLLEVNQCMC